MSLPSLSGEWMWGWGSGLFLANLLEGWRESGQLLSSCVYNVQLWNFSHSRKTKGENSCSILLHIPHKCAGHGHMSPRARSYCSSGKWNILASFLSPVHMHGLLFTLLYTALYCLTFENNLFYFYMYKNLNMNNSPLGSSLLLNCGKQMYQNS